MQSPRSKKSLDIFMKTLATWNPFGELNEVENRLASFFGGKFPRFGHGNEG
jgi:hypothetical protein